MEITPDTIGAAHFDEHRRGYDQEQVRQFLAEVGSAYGKLIGHARDLSGQVDRLQASLEEARSGPSEMEEAQHAARTLMLAQRTADAHLDEARHQAEATLSQARAEADRLVETARTESNRLLSSSRDESERALSTARAEASRLVETARTEAQYEADHERARWSEELAGLEERRALLVSDLEALEERMDTYRSALTGLSEDLGGILEHPERLRTLDPVELQAPPPESTGVSTGWVVSDPVDASEPVAVLAPDEAGLAQSDLSESQGVAGTPAEVSQVEEWRPGTWAELDAAAVDQHEVAGGPDDGGSAEGAVSDGWIGGDAVVDGRTGIEGPATAEVPGVGWGDDPAATNTSVLSPETNSRFADETPTASFERPDLTATSALRADSAVGPDALLSAPEAGVGRRGADPHLDALSSLAGEVDAFDTTPYVPNQLFEGESRVAGPEDAHTAEHFFDQDLFGGVDEGVSAGGGWDDFGTRSEHEEGFPGRLEDDGFRSATSEIDTNHYAADFDSVDGFTMEDPHSFALAPPESIGDEATPGAALEILGLPQDPTLTGGGWADLDQPTQALPVLSGGGTGFGPGPDRFLADLEIAMSDEHDSDAEAAQFAAFLEGDDEPQPRRRFGRRRD